MVFFINDIKIEKHQNPCELCVSYETSTSVSGTGVNYPKIKQQNTCEL